MRSKNIIATPPGATISEQLELHGMNKKEFSARMDMSERQISMLLNGDTRLTADIALRLEGVLGVPARFWSNLEGIYREKLAKVRTENETKPDSKKAKRAQSMAM